MTTRVETLDSIADSVLTQAAAGDQAAFQQIVERFHNDLVRVGYAVAGDVETGRDAAQAAWETAWRKLSTLRTAEKLRPWLLVIAANEARRIMRRKRLRSVLELRGYAPSEEPELEARAGGLDLTAAMRRLSARDRQILAMRYAIGLSSEEIADVVGMSSSGVRTQIARLLERLRRELSHD